MRPLYVMGLLYLAVSVAALVRGPAPLYDDGGGYDLADFTSDGGAWFRKAKPYCNALEVETVHRRIPPPTTLQGTGFSAACWALAGRIAEARARIAPLRGDDQWKAAGIVFEIGHPVADMGDDRSAGPIMELVVEFWPNHYQALYHAGAARFGLGQYTLAERHLREFLQYYNAGEDGWTRSARAMLATIEAR